jgi:hypothetical protein
MFQKFYVGDTDEFDPAAFPQLTATLHQLAAQLINYPQGPKSEMILSFVKHHSMPSQQVKDFPEVADLISTRSLPTHVMEDLFASGKQNSLFKQQLETYIQQYFIQCNL